MWETELQITLINEVTFACKHLGSNDPTGYRSTVHNEHSSGQFTQLKGK